MKIKAIGIRRSKSIMYKADFSKISNNFPEPFQLVPKNIYDSLIAIKKAIIERESEINYSVREEQIDE